MFAHLQILIQFFRPQWYGQRSTLVTEESQPKALYAFFLSELNHKGSNGIIEQANISLNAWKMELDTENNDLKWKK